MLFMHVEKTQHQTKKTEIIPSINGVFDGRVLQFPIKVVFITLWPKYLTMTNSNPAANWSVLHKFHENCRLTPSKSGYVPPP